MKLFKAMADILFYGSLIFTALIAMVVLFIWAMSEQML